jgi:PEGA domain
MPLAATEPGESMRNAWLFLNVLALVALAQAGCVERRYVIVTDPPGAVVERNGELLGATPADDHFIYYGKYQFKIVKPGYETLQVKQDIPAPWYEFIGVDFLSENIWPFNIVDRREFHYQLVPLMQPQTNDLLREADNLRNRGKSIPPPPGTILAAPVQPGAVVQVPGVTPVPPPTLQPPLGSGPSRVVQPAPGPSMTPPPPGIQAPPPTLQPPTRVVQPAPGPAPGTPPPPTLQP